MSQTALDDAVRVVVQRDDQSGEGKGDGELTLIDDIEGVRVNLSTGRRVRPVRCSRAEFQFPVDVAYELSPLALWTDRFNPILVRDSAGDICVELTDRESVSLPPAQYTVDICSLGLKVYLRVTGPLAISYTEQRGRVMDCRGAESVRLGLRSLHESPAATVTTTAEPRDVMRTLSCLGSALKTTSCERSFPTLRGQPPLIEHGERFQDPAELERTPQTASVRLELPPTLEHIYPVAPLAYYLNAVVVPGETPQLVADGHTIPLDRGDGIEQGAARLLKRCFTMDCLTRTEGHSSITLGERTTFETRLADASLDIDFADLYNRPLAAQLQRYTTIPYDLLKDLIPRWPLTADVRPVASYLPYLPFVVASLGTVRCLSTSCSWSPSSDPPEIEAFCRTGGHETTCEGGETASATQSEPTTRSSEDGFDRSHSSTIHSPPATESIAQLWLAEGYPIQGTKPTLPAFERRFDAIKADGYEVAVVSNDVQMDAESEVAELYGQRERLDFDVTIRRQVTRAELREVFLTGYDLVHYVGHVDERGLQCADGWLDVHGLETVNIRMFVLNGCQSYEQGMALVERGAVSGLCTLTNVGNTPATRIGRTVARLLNRGFSLSGVLDIIGEDTLTGQQYMIVGDPSRGVVHRHDDTSIVAEITPVSDSDEFLVDVYGYPSVGSPIGMLYVPAIGDKEAFYLNSGHMTTVTVSRTELTKYLHHDRFPVQFDGSLTWSDTITLDSID